MNAPFQEPTLGENPWAKIMVGNSGLNENRSDGLKISWKLDMSVVLIVFDFSLKVVYSVVSIQVAVKFFTADFNVDGHFCFTR